MEEKKEVINRLISSVEEMIDILEEKERDDDDFTLSREVAESLLEELGELL